MSENPLEAIFKTFDKISQSIRTQLSKFAGFSNHSSPTNGRPPFSLASSFKANPLNASNDSSLLRPKLIPSEDKSTTPVTKEELGRSTWIFLHTLAAQYPDNPTRQQRKDVKELMEILSRMYPCKDCADHFKEILRSNPVQAGSQAEFSQWLCHVHNVVNRSLGKVAFSCERVDARWGKLECEQRACDLQGSVTNFGDDIQ
ncbi:FAD-linked sulfhydryl oxidase [Actinidia chinensis var. chinensis]|uniref:Sulfhydryl oxidase n=1 Tax=Actinidia chinensis var. chinensis TaxID=1590841 RepID=A0A2R6RC32_ACTCC|nr:FAD-linked sulfhydryl oxidase [Actinidia chinensis var. chinensis]